MFGSVSTPIFTDLNFGKFSCNFIFILFFLDDVTLNRFCYVDIDVTCMTSRRRKLQTNDMESADIIPVYTCAAARATDSVNIVAIFGASVHQTGHSKLIP